MRFIIFAENEKAHRVHRFRQEAKQRNIPFLLVNTSKMLIAEKHVFIDGEKEPLEITSDDTLWFVSNSKINHYLIKRFSAVASFVWPTAEMIDFADKFYGNSFFSSIGIPTPKTVLVNVNSLEMTERYLGKVPWVMKKNISSGGEHVGLVHSREEMELFAGNVLSKKISKSLVPRGNRAFLLQEFIAESAGEDFRVICIGGKAVGCIKRSSNNDFRANVSLGGTPSACELDAEMVALSESIAEKGKLFYAGIDFIKGKHGYLAIEINTSAQFEGFEAATGENIAGKILDALV